MKNKNSIIVLLVFYVISLGDSKSNLNLFAIQSIDLDENEQRNWEYADQFNWRLRFPTCGGIRQSPIAIDKTFVQSVHDGEYLKWLNYPSFHDFLILNSNGHTVEASSSWENEPIPELQGGPLSGSYRFFAIHWHWGNKSFIGSEHMINDDIFPMEMHAIHFNSKFQTLNDAVSSGESEAVVVVAVLFNLSTMGNRGIQIIQDALKRSSTLGMQHETLPLGELGLNFKQKYFTYLGSLTTPPCQQVARWIIREEPLLINNQQLRFFQNLVVNGRRVINNFRLLQPLNNRLIEYFV